MSIEEYEKMIAEYQNQITVINEKIEKLKGIKYCATVSERREKEDRTACLWDMKLGLQHDLKQMIQYVKARKEREQK